MAARSRARGAGTLRPGAGGDSARAAPAAGAAAAGAATAVARRHELAAAPGSRTSRRRPPLRLLTAADLAERSRRRHARAIALCSVAVLLAALLAVAGAQAVVASQQVRLDDLRQQLATSVAADQALQLTHAQLASPERVLEVAERGLGMVVPASVTYLSALAPAAARPATHRTRPRAPASARL